MVEISISDDHLRLEVKGLDKLWAFKSQLDIPFQHIRDVWHDPEAASDWSHGIKVAGTNLPGVLTAGTFYQQDGRTVFWDVHNPDNAIVIELHDDRFDELVVEVTDPLSAVDQITAKIQK